MNMNVSQTTTDESWDELYRRLVKHEVNLLAGDFNMSLTQVVPRLTARGLNIDTCSWYPWLHEEKHAQEICLGMDSLAIFYIRGDVRCELQWECLQNRRVDPKSCCPLHTAVAALQAAVAANARAAHMLWQ